MIIDAHAHVYAFPKIVPGPDHYSTFVSAEQLVAIMDRLGVDKAVILPLVCAETASEPQSLGEILMICERYPGRFIPFCNMDPRIARKPEQTRLEDYEFILKQYKAFGCKGLGELTARMPTDHPQVMLLMAACARLGLPVTIHTITDAANSYGLLDDIGLPRLEKVMRALPELKIIGHSQGFWSEISGDVTAKTKNGYPQGPVTPGGRIPELMRRYPGLYADISAGSGFNALTRDTEFGFQFIEEFQDRLLLGLDICQPPKEDPPHIKWLTESRDAGRISTYAFEKITWRNADRLLELGLA